MKTPFLGMILFTFTEIAPSRCEYRTNPAGTFFPRPLRRCLPTGYPRLAVCEELSGSAQKNGDNALTAIIP
jgi:hypothetical protein